MRPNIVIYGVGKRFEKDTELIGLIREEACIIAFADKAYDKVVLPEQFDGISIVSPIQLRSMDYDGIFVTSDKYRDEITDELVSQGVSKEKIMDRDAIKRLLLRNEKKWYGRRFINNKAHKRVLILTTDMGLSGGILVSVYAALSLKQKGIDVLLVTPSITKEMLALLNRLELPVLVKPALPHMYQEDKEWYKEYDYVIVTVFQMINCAMHIGIEKPVLWWIHEPKSRWTNYYEDTIDKFPECNNRRWMKYIDIAAVSDIALKSFNSYYGNVIRKCLPFGIPDENRECRIVPIVQNRVNFAILAGYGEIKGHDVFFEAIRKLSPKIRDCISLKLIGVSDVYQSEVMSKIGGYCPVQICGVLTHQEVCEKFDSIDVVVCPSFIETMSMTVIEGMMYGKVCIASDNTGIAGYIDGTNGFVFKTGDSSCLAEIIKAIICGEINLSDVQKRARETYEKMFSLEVFYNNFMDIAGNKL